MQGTRPETQFDPSETWETTEQQGRETRLSRFDEVHFQQDRDLVLSVIRVERTSARGTKRDPRVSWFLTLDTLVPLEQVPPRYGLRFSEEHLFRFLKQDLLWLAAHVRTPEQFLRWSWIVALAFLQLYLARPLGLSALLPWEAKGRPVTPRQVRRVMPTILSQLPRPTGCATRLLLGVNRLLNHCRSPHTPKSGGSCWPVESWDSLRDALLEKDGPN